MSANSHSNAPSIRRLRRAAAWRMRLRHADFTKSLCTRWENWIEVPENQQAFEATGKLWDRIEDMRTSLKEAATASNPIPEPCASEDPERNDTSLLCSKRRLGSLLWKAAASLAAIALIGLIWNVIGPQPDTIQTHRYEQQEKRLADASVLYVGQQTQIKLQFSDTQRLVNLVRGEAAFGVAKDPSRPFIVTTESVLIHAVGTEFSVVNSPPSVVVTVTEGIVNVSRRMPADSVESISSVTLLEGEQLTITAHNSRLPSVKVATEPEIAWIQGWFVFNGATFQQAVAEFNRRNRVQIQLANEISQHKLGYYHVRADDSERFAGMLATFFALKLTRVDSNTLRLEPK